MLLSLGAVSRQFAEVVKLASEACDSPEEQLCYSATQQQKGIEEVVFAPPLLWNGWYHQSFILSTFSDPNIRSCQKSASTQFVNDPIYHSSIVNCLSSATSAKISRRIYFHGSRVL